MPVNGFGGTGRYEVLLTGRCIMHFEFLFNTFICKVLKEIVCLFCSFLSNLFVKACLAENFHVEAMLLFTRRASLSSVSLTS